ncbi:SDR family NAD(P)-dependent oxidoreductase [Spirosoma flavum]|uniref:SDR family NAD(P)-dependent oxidoreductase n=1 Tax=Spirosoma flavum TaxID=2048557 RepID=A0ABW6AT50_9BACT
MLLTNKVTVIYGASGAVGSTVAMTFARERATLFLTGHSRTGVGKLAGEINAAGGSAEAAQVDELDERAVEVHLNRISSERVDLTFHLMRLGFVTPPYRVLYSPTWLSLDQFMAPIQTHVQANFITARLAGRLIAAKGSGVIMTVTSTPSRIANPLMGGVAVAMAAQEALIRDLSVELGPKGDRVLGIRTHGMSDSDTIKEVFGLHARAYDITREQFQQLVAERTHRKRLPSLQEMA